MFLIAPVDGVIKVIVLASAWKFGAAFDGWLGMMVGGERGLEQETAEEYAPTPNKGMCLRYNMQVFDVL